MERRRVMCVAAGVAGALGVGARPTFLSRYAAGTCLIGLVYSILIGFGYLCMSCFFT